MIVQTDWTVGSGPNPLHNILNLELFVKHLCNPRIPIERNCAAHPHYINYHLKSEVSITFRCWLSSTRYTAVQIKNCSESTSAIKITTMKNTDISISKESYHVLPPNLHLLLSAKMNGAQRRTLVSP